MEVSRRGYRTNELDVFSERGSQLVTKAFTSLRNKRIPLVR